MDIKSDKDMSPTTIVCGRCDSWRHEIMGILEGVMTTRCLGCGSHQRFRVILEGKWSPIEDEEYEDEEE